MMESNEELAYELIRPTICEVIRKNYLHEDDLQFQQGQGYWSISYAGALIARLHFGKKISFLSLDAKTAKGLLENCDIPHDVKASEKNFVRILLQQPEDILPVSDVIAAVVQRVLDAIPKAFDCCGRYNDCSDAKMCVQPDDALRIGCGYRKVLASGRIFYGKNAM